jgi:hypothetical protein
MSEREFPPRWVQLAELRHSPRLAGIERLDQRQKVVLVQTLNERTCDCGCELGSLAKCLRDDSLCPRSPRIGKLAVAMTAQNRSLAEILQTIDEENPPRPPVVRPKSVPQPLVERSFEPPPGAVRTGSVTAPVSIVVFGNYQCPYCRMLDRTLEELPAQYGDALTIAQVHFPLEIHRGRFCAPRNQNTGATGAAALESCVARGGCQHE